MRDLLRRSLGLWVLSGTLVQSDQSRVSVHARQTGGRRATGEPGLSTAGSTAIPTGVMMTWSQIQPFTPSKYGFESITDKTSRLPAHTIYFLLRPCLKSQPLPRWIQYPVLITKPNAHQWGLHMLNVINGVWD